MKKRGLVIVYDPHNLYQFIWYYCNVGKKIDWDALCLPNDKKGEYMHYFCEATEIFGKVYKGSEGFKSAKAKEKIVIFAKMLVYYVLGQRKRYCRKLINRYVEFDKYDQIVILTCVGLISGACAALSDEKEVVILEDGVADYWKRTKHMQWKHLRSTYHWQGFMLSHMGYCCPGWFLFKPEKNCIKYSSRPDLMDYSLYKEIRQLYESKGTDDKLLSSIVKRTYPQISEIDFGKMEAIFLSIPLCVYVNKTDIYQERLEKYLADKYGNVLVKRHPRDTMKYAFGKSKMIEIDSSIPAEVIMPYLNNMDVYMCESCATVMYARPYNLNCKVIVLDGFYEESLAEGVEAKAPSEEEVRAYVNRFGGTGCSVIKI